MSSHYRVMNKIYKRDVDSPVIGFLVMYPDGSLTAVTPMEAAAVVANKNVLNARVRPTGSTDPDKAYSISPDDDYPAFSPITLAEVLSNGYILSERFHGKYHS